MAPPVTARVHDLLDDRKQIEGRAGEPVDPRHRHHVAGGERLKELEQLAPVGPRAGCLLAVNPGAPPDAEAYLTLAAAMLRHGDYEGALAEAEIASALSPNLALAHGTLGETLIFSGRPKEGLAAVQTSIRLDPHDPKLAIRLNNLALCLYFSGEYEAAVEAAKRAVRANPDFPLAYRWLAAALGQLGRTAEALKRKKRWRRLSRSRQRRSTCMSASACLGTGQKITPTCWRDCATPDGRAEAAVVASPTIQLNRC